MKVSKPTILCLHGSGTSADIFRIQASRLTKLLSAEFDFLFIDAPFLSDAGPGVLPFFEGCDPFYTWSTEDAKSDTPRSSSTLVSSSSSSPRESLQDLSLSRDADGLAQACLNSPAAASLHLIRSVLAQHKEHTGADVVGVMGFSMGGRLATGLLALQQRGMQGLNFRFAVLCNSTSPPFFYDSIAINKTRNDQFSDDLFLSKGAEGNEVELINIPALHVIGSVDPWRPKSEKLVDYFEDPSDVGGVGGVLMLEGVGHAMPLMQKATESISEKILDMARKEKCI